MMLVGPRRAGKTEVTKRLLRLEDVVSRFTEVHIVCPSLDHNFDYDEFRSNDKFQFHPNPSKSVVRKILVGQQEKHHELVEQIRLYKRQKHELNKAINLGIYQGADEAQEKSFVLPSILVVLDDCIDTGLISMRSISDTLTARGRHFGISVIILSQALTSISFVARINSDYMLLFQPWEFLEMEKFLARFVEKDQHKDILREMKRVFETKYNFIFVNNATSLAERLSFTNADAFLRKQWTYFNTRAIK